MKLQNFLFPTIRTKHIYNTCVLFSVATNNFIANSFSKLKDNFEHNISEKIPRLDIQERSMYKDTKLNIYVYL